MTTYEFTPEMIVFWILALLGVGFLLGRIVEGGWLTKHKAGKELIPPMRNPPTPPVRNKLPPPAPVPRDNDGHIIWPEPYLGHHSTEQKQPAQKRVDYLKAQASALRAEYQYLTRQERENVDIGEFLRQRIKHLANELSMHRGKSDRSRPDTNRFVPLPPASPTGRTIKEGSQTPPPPPSKPRNEQK
ncbi:hypothetical protein [Spirosoma arcticum]